MTTFDKIQKNEEKQVAKEVDARTKNIHEVKDKVLTLLKESALSVQDASIVLRITQETINGSLVERQLTDFL